LNVFALDNYKVRQKSSPLKFFAFFQQPFGILIRNFTDLFTATFYS